MLRLYKKGPERALYTVKTADRLWLPREKGQPLRAGTGCGALQPFRVYPCAYVIGGHGMLDGLPFGLGKHGRKRNGYIGEHYWMNSVITLYSKTAVLSTIDGELTDYNSQLSMYIVCEVHRII